MSGCDTYLATAQQGAAQFGSWKTANATNTAELDMMKSCLESEAARLDALVTSADATTIAQLVSEKSQKEDELKIARDRVRYIRNPDRPVSYYESWFPSGRPLQKTTILALLSAAIFLVLVTLLLVSASFGYFFTLVTPVRTNGNSGSGAFSPVLAWLRSFGTPFWILLIAFIAVLIHFLR